METLFQDLRVAVRGFLRAPSFPLTAIATLALGIGATTAIFTALSAVLLKPLPYPEPERLYSLRTALTDGRVTTGLLSGSEIFRLNDPKLSIERAAAFQPAQLTLLSADDTPSAVTVYAVSEGFFELFGLPMTLGGFKHEDHAVFQPPPNAPPQPGPLPAVIISTRLWKSLYNGDQQVIGKPIRFAEFSSTISGVAPNDFDMPHNADIWLAQRTPETDVNHGQEGFMRLKPGATIARAEDEMSTVMNGLARDFPGANRNRIYVTRPLVEQMVGDLGPILIIVMSATGLLLLLACVNVANLLLARGAARANEMAVRAALGAGWPAGPSACSPSPSCSRPQARSWVWVSARWACARCSRSARRGCRVSTPTTFDCTRASVHARHALAHGRVIGLAPAIRLMRSDMKTLMNDSSRSAIAGRGTARWLMSMTVAEVAIAIMLVAGAGWLVRDVLESSQRRSGVRR